MKILGVIFCLLLLFVIFSCKRSPELIPRKILFGNPAKAGPQISPDGKSIAYLAPREGILNIWVRSLQGGDDRPVTHDKKQGISQYFWLQDSAHLVFLQDKDGDENAHLYLVNLASGETKDLTPFDGVKVQILAADKHFPDEFLVQMNRENPKLYDVYRLRWKTGELTLAAKNLENVSSWVPDRELKIRGAVIAGGRGDYAVMVRDTEQSPWRKVAEWQLEDNLSCDVHGFSKDGKFLFMSDSRNSNTGRLVKLDLSTGKETVLAEDPEYDTLGMVLNPETYEPQLVLYIKEKMEWKILDESLRKDIENLKRIEGGQFSLAGRDNADQIWIIRSESDRAPVSYYVYYRQTGEAFFLFDHQPELRHYKLAEMRPVSFQSRDGFTLHGYLTLPVRGPQKNLPLVLKVHGGPWSRDVWGYDSRVQWFADRGYACLQVNFRGSTTYGKKFVNAGNKEWGGKMQDDLTDAVQWAVREGIADPKRVAIFGGSYGGYAALAGAVFTPDLYRAAVAVVGPSNLITFLNSIPPYWETERANIRARVGDPETEQEFLKSRSPLFSAGRVRIPLLIAQGANDPRVKKAESEQMVEAMKKHNLPVEYLLFEDEGHGFAKPENQMKFFKAAEKFLAKHLGGRFEK